MIAVVRGRGLPVLVAATALAALAFIPALGSADAPKRIIGGEIADPAEWQSTAALMTEEGDHICGASVIAPRYVLTAAHCVVRWQSKMLRIVTGRPDLSEESEGQTLRVKEISVRPRYFRRGTPDAAVLELKDDSTASPIALPTREESTAATAIGSELRVAGWGSTRRNGSKSSQQLRAGETFTIKERKCERAFPHFRARHGICTRGAPFGKHDASACYGDSGGPLVADTPGGARLVGLVSYGGIRCGVKDPTVYHRVASTLGFIEKHSGVTP